MIVTRKELVTREVDKTYAACAGCQSEVEVDGRNRQVLPNGWYLIEDNVASLEFGTLNDSVTVCSRPCGALYFTSEPE